MEQKNEEQNIANQEQIKAVAEEVKEKVVDITEKTVEYAKDTKEKYDQATPETQEKIKKGIIGSASALALLIGLKKIFKKKK